MMATNAKRKNPENQENSELEVMRAKIRKLEQKNFELEATVKANEQLLMQMTKKGEVDLDHHEVQENDVIDFLSAFMNNPGFKPITDNLLSFLDSKSFIRCREVCRSWKDFLDNEWSMLQLQIFHLKRYETQRDDDPFWPLLNKYRFNFKPLIKIMEKTTNKSKLRVFIQMCRELVSKRCDRRLAMDPHEYMIDHHRHQELKMLLHCPIQSYPVFKCFTRIFKYACQFGCEICVKTFLDRSEEKEIDLNLVKEKENYHREAYEYEHCLFAANRNGGSRKEVLDLLLRSAEEKGIDIHVKSQLFGITLRDEIIENFKEDAIVEYTEATYKILKIDPSVDLKFD